MNSTTNNTHNNDEWEESREHTLRNINNLATDLVDSWTEEEVRLYAHQALVATLTLSEKYFQKMYDSIYGSVFVTRK